LKCIKMTGTAAGPDFVLNAGSVYLVPDSLAKKMLSARMVGPRGAMDGPPAAEPVTDPRLIEKAKRLTSKPDPDDHDEIVEPDLMEDDE